jgi:hypothetical protein
MFKVGTKKGGRSRSFFIILPPVGFSLPRFYHPAPLQRNPKDFYEKKMSRITVVKLYWLMFRLIHVSLVPDDPLHTFYRQKVLLG